MSIVKNTFPRYATSFAVALIVTFSAVVGVLHYFPGYGLLFLGFCYLMGLGLLPWFKGSRAFGASSGIAIGVIGATVWLVQAA